MSTSAKGGYHHGDLRAALLTTAMQMLENGETFSLRAVARNAGVSATAPYRHFPDRDALESALAVQGFGDLEHDLTADRDLPTSTADLAEFGVAYVDFALRRPALFRLMFGKPCDGSDDERVRAADALHELLAQALANVAPQSDTTALACAGWSLAHGLASLHLDGKLPADSPEEVPERVRSAFLAITTVQDTP
ncbi:TetR/AcrR family transcriptional regulator [Saccharopolyspora tripterygii]